MMEKNKDLHRLLTKQIKKELCINDFTKNIENFLNAVSSAYTEYEEDRELMERSIEISSREYNEKTYQLEKAEKHLANLLETIPLGIINTDCNGTIIFGNSKAFKIFEIPKEKLIGLNFDDYLWEVRAPEGGIVSEKKLPFNVVSRAKEQIVGVEYSITTANMTNKILQVNAAPIFDENQNISGMVASIEDITLRKQMEEQLKYLSLHDSLTGLYNRTYFEEEMYRLGNGRYNPVGIIIIDIDGLKLVNDTMGHEEGDMLLCVAGNIIKRCFREDDIVARIGSDEFAVLLTSCSRDKIDSACKRVRDAVDRYNLDKSVKIPLSISCGYSITEANDINAIFEKADNNMHREKLHHHQSVRSTIVHTLTKAMEARDFCTEEHANRLCDLVKELAKRLNLSGSKTSDLMLFAQFHDIGKVGIPDRILFKPGPLNQEEKTQMRRHCEIGHHIAQSSPDLLLISDWILKHQQ